MFSIYAVLCLAALASGQRRYYSLEDMPETNFDCRDKILGGYYADPEANCQMFHVCVKIPGQGVQDFRFLCPNETAFDQENQICADSGDIDCEAAGLYLENFDLYRIGSAPSKRPLFNPNKGTVVPLGPSTKSPIFTNNINEEDEFYLQRSDTGDRRLHSKDLLRGSSSSNFFNNRNKGKDLEDDDDEEAPRSAGATGGQFRQRQNNFPRAKTQYNSQQKKTETTPQPQTTPRIENQNQLNDKKRTKIAVRKLTRKKPEEEVSEPQRTSPQPNYSSFTTQVTQKYTFGDSDSRYNTVSRVQTTPSTVPTTPQRYQPNFRPKNEPSSTPAFFEPGPVTTKPFNSEPLRQPIVATGGNFQNNQNRPQVNYQQNRPATAAPANNVQPTQNYPAGNSFPQNRQNTPITQQNFQGQTRPQQQGNFQAQRPGNAPGQINFQAPRAGPTAAPAPVTQNFQRTNQPSATPVNNQNNQPQRPNTPPTPQNNFQAQRSSQTPIPANGQTFQPARTNPPSPTTYQTTRQNQPTNNGNFQFQGRSNQQTSNGNFQTGRTDLPTNYPTDPSTVQGQRQTTVSLPPNTRAQNINNGLLGRPAGQNRNFFGRNNDDFEEGDNQEFLKTAPSNNFRPSDLNSFKTNYKQENSDRGSQTLPSTIKYYTPTIVTTPKAPSTYSDTTVRQTYSSPQASSNQASSQNFYTQPPARKIQPAPSSTARPPTSRPVQQTPISTKSPETKDAAYDYAYYDDGGSFSEYDSLGDTLGETDFSRTSQRSKARLI